MPQHVILRKIVHDDSANSQPTGRPHRADLHKMCVDHFNEPMISFGKLARCIGYGETAVDCYIITQLCNGEILWNTCVGGYVFLDRLKGQGYVKSTGGEDWDDLTRLESELREAPKKEKFLLLLDHNDWEGNLPIGARIEQFIKHMDELNARDMIEIRREITKYLTIRDAENGTTKWAEEL
ncbi:MAG: hypothetical protein Q7N50_10765 [Armatimonadota bacterium]|nr:hypothetical protein [Armatimonadota bacterium]